MKLSTLHDAEVAVERTIYSARFACEMRQHDAIDSFLMDMRGVLFFTAADRARYRIDQFCQPELGLADPSQRTYAIY